MSIQEPAWLKRSRPCPFYSHGRCLFADSCNFLHDVKVRNTRNHHTLSGSSQTRHSESFLPKPVFVLPSVVVDSASPRPVNPESLSSPVQDYSGLLSVLSDVIGPPSNPPTATEDASLAVSSGPNNTTAGSPLESDLVASDFESVGETGRGSSSLSILQPDSEADPFRYLTNPFFPEGGDESVTAFLPVPDDTESVDGDTTSYVVEEMETAVEFEADDDDDDAPNGQEDEDFTLMASNRHSTLSSFTGASLLASPRHSVFGEPFVPSFIDGAAVDLLSPVQLSARLRPFPIPSMNSTVKRGESIDSGYADGDSWVGPLPFSRSPPRSFRSSMSFLSHSRQASHSSTAHKEQSVSYGLGAQHTSPHCPIEGIVEVESDGCSQHGLEDNEETAYNILDAYDMSPSQQNKARDLSQLGVDVVEEKAEDEVPRTAVICSPRRYSEHLHPTGECDLDSCNQPSCVSDDNLSFRTALEAPLSVEDLNDKVSPVKQGSLVSSTSGCSTPDTSVLSYYSDAIEPLGSIVSSHVDESSFLVTTDLASQIDNHEISEAITSEESFPAEVTIVSNVLSPTAIADGPQRLALERVVTAQEPLPPVSSPSTDASYSLSSVRDVLGCAANGIYGSSVPSPVVSQELPQSLVEEKAPDAATEYLESVHDSFLSFPLPPPPDLVGDDKSPLSRQDVFVLPGATVEIESACLIPQEEEVQRVRSGSDLTEKVRPSQLPLVGPSDPDADFTLRRSRAASDLTVKGKQSPVITPGGTPYISSSPSRLPVEPQGRSDSVQSLYDQYLDDGALADGSGFYSPAHKVIPPLEDPSQEAPLQSPLFFQGESSPCSDSKPSNSGINSPLSETVLRPLLIGGRLSLRPSPAELGSKINVDSIKEPSCTPLSTRLQAREIGSTMVPLGFRRHKPQSAARTQSSRTTSQPLQTVLPASQLREVLRIRTDITQEDFPPGCSSASQVSFIPLSPLPAQSMSAPPTVGLKQLHLSSIINKRSSILSTHSSSIASSILSLDRLFNASAPQSPSVSSITSFSRNSSFSSSCGQIPEQIHHTLKSSHSNSPILQVTDDAQLAPHSFSTVHESRSISPPIQQSKSWRLSHYRAGSRNYTSVDSTRRFSRRASTLSLSYAVNEAQEFDEDDATASHPIPSNHTGDWMRPASVLIPPAHAIATPKPTLLFAIASDDVDQVRQVLESGEAGPNDSVGPQSALAFTLTNEKLTHKPEIVKALLAYGANPSALRNPTFNPPPRMQGTEEPTPPPRETTLEGMDPATRYFVTRADATHTRQTSQLIYRSFFRPLTRVRYDVIGQDWALEQLFRVLSMHSQKLAVAPIVVFLCGPSGHGKSLLARKFGFLLDVPTHTVNMTTLQSAHDIWQSYSMSPYEEPSSCTLAEFLIENEGKRCVVVLDEIEKIEDQKALWSLLMPWELGRCSLEAGKRHVDARNVIWLATSNIGHEEVFEYHENRAEPDERMSRDDYLELTGILRPRVSHCLGASLVSRVTTVLPFVPFTLDEKKAIAAEAVYAFAGDTSKTLSPQEVESLVTKALPSYQPSEGARSLHRAISNILIDTMPPDVNLAR